MKICFLGGGNMASALIGGLIARGTPASDLSVIELNPAARERLAQKFAIHVASAPDDACVAGCDTLVLAVKPQDLRAAVFKGNPPGDRR